MAKRCTRCLQWKERSDFYRDRSKLDGLKSHCKPCHEQYKKEYRARVHEQDLSRLRRIYRFVWQRKAPSMKAINNAGLRRWQARNQARRRARIGHYLRRWHAHNQVATTDWYAQTPHVPTAMRQSYRAVDAAVAINDLTPQEWKWLIDAYDQRCAYCGQRTDALSPDHVRPLSQGGHNSLANVVPSCRACNTRKGGRTPEQAGMPFVVRVNINTHLIQLGLI